MPSMRPLSVPGQSTRRQRRASARRCERSSPRSSTHSAHAVSIAATAELFECPPPSSLPPPSPVPPPSSSPSPPKSSAVTASRRGRLPPPAACRGIDRKISARSLFSVSSSAAADAAIADAAEGAAKDLEPLRSPPPLPPSSPLRNAAICCAYRRRLASSCCQIGEERRMASDAGSPLSVENAVSHARSLAPVAAALRSSVARSPRSSTLRARSGAELARTGLGDLRRANAATSRGGRSSPLPPPGGRLSPLPPRRELLR